MLTLALAGLLSGVTIMTAPVRLVSAQVAEPGWTFTGDLNTRRYAHTATLLLNGKVLVAGGAGPNSCFTPTNSAELYDPVSGTWSYTGFLNTARIDHTATLLQNGQVLIAGGSVNHYMPMDFINGAELYDPATGTWRPTGGFKTIRALDTAFSHGSATLLPNGKVLALGAIEAFHGVNSAELYDPATGTWSRTGTNTSVVGEHAVLLSNGKVLAVSKSLAKLYDPSIDQWSATGNLNISAETLTLLQNGKVLATSGQSAELYDPNTGTWSISGNLRTAHFGAYGGNVATMLADGRVLMTGIAEELFDPTAGTWSFTSSLMPTRLFHTATLLQNGKVLAAGGMDGGLDGCDVSIYSTSKLFDSGTLTNPIDDPQFFVRQHYLDFLNRDPDADGLAFWTNEIISCGGDAQCIDAKRINVSAAYFLSIEFQQTGYLVYRFYKASYGNVPGAPVPVRLDEFLPDTKEIGQGVVVNQSGWEQVLESNKQAFATEFVQHSRFVSAYPTSMSSEQFVDALFANAGVAPTANDRTAVINEFPFAATTNDVAARARALRRVAENSTLAQQEFNRAFVLMQYFGYLRRNPNDPPEATLDYQGYNFWLNKLNQFDGDFVQAEMVRAFLVSSEYRQRFALP